VAGKPAMAGGENSGNKKARNREARAKRMTYLQNKTRTYWDAGF